LACAPFFLTRAGRRPEADGQSTTVQRRRLRVSIRPARSSRHQESRALVTAEAGTGCPLSGDHHLSIVRREFHESAPSRPVGAAAAELRGQPAGQRVGRVRVAGRPLERATLECGGGGGGVVRAPPGWRSAAPAAVQAMREGRGWTGAPEVICHSLWGRIQLGEVCWRATRANVVFL
jgi:hypothetical protein